MQATAREESKIPQMTLCLLLSILKSQSDTGCIQGVGAGTPILSHLATLTKTRSKPLQIYQEPTQIYMEPL